MPSFLSSSSRMVNIFVLLRFNIWWENARRNIYEEAKFSETSGNVKTSVSECHIIFFFINIDRNIEKHLWKEASSETSESWRQSFGVCATLQRISTESWTSWQKYILLLVTMSRLFIIITCKIVSLSSSPSFIASFRRCSASCSSCHLLMETMIFDSSFTLSLIRDDSDDELYIIGAVCMPVCL